MDEDKEERIKRSQQFDSFAPWQHPIECVIRRPLIPEPRSDTRQLRPNYVANSEEYHYRRPIESVHIHALIDQPETLSRPFGTCMVRPSLLLRTYFKRLGGENRTISFSSWKALLNYNPNCFLMKYFGEVLGFGAEQLAKDLQVLYSHLLNNPELDVADYLTVRIDDYYGDKLTIKEGLILQLIADEFGLGVKRSSEDESFDLET